MFRKRKILKNVNHIGSFQINDESVLLFRVTGRIPDVVLVHTKNALEKTFKCTCFILPLGIELESVTMREK